MMTSVFLAFCLLANQMPDNSSLSSTNASYDGSNLVLTGHVVLDHGLGKMTAEEASLEKQEVGKDFPFSHIQLRKEVLLALKNSSQILCDKADLDFNALKGILHSSEDGYVVFTDVLKKSALKLSGHLVELNFAKHDQEGKKSEFEVQSILAKEGVIIDYSDDFQLMADHALYRRETSSSNKTSKKEFQGFLTAYPKDAASQCRITHQGDVIDADMVDLDLVHSKISLLHPKGILAAALLPHVEQAGEMRFRSEHLYWDQIKNILTLKGQIAIDEPSLGTLCAQDEMQITQATVKGKRLLQKIHSQGPTHLIYKDSHGRSHKLISQGIVNFEREHLKATIESPDHEGLVSRDKQLYYEEDELALYADNAALEYSAVGDTIHPASLTLKGNVRLFSHDPHKPFRCGLADRMTYSLVTQTLILSANPGKKVLFWDEMQGMRLAAPEVHITFDPQTKEQQVKGIGAVQFTFTPEEQSKLQQFFPQLQKLQ